MIKIIRPDYQIIENGDMLFLQNIKMKDVCLQLTRAEAVYLALRDGERDENEVESIAKEIFGHDLFPLSSVCRFLLSKENGTEVLTKYDPKRFIKKKLLDTTSCNTDKTIPRYLVLCLTRKCGRHCAYCYARPEHSYRVESDVLSYDEINKILVEASELAIEGILLTGGEPMMHPLSYEIIREATRKNMHVYVATKHRLKKEELVSVSKELFHVSLSIDSHISIIANMLTGSLTFYEDIMHNIEILNELDMPFYIKSVVTKVNKDSLIDMCRYMQKYHALGIETDHYMCDEQKYINKELMMSEEEKIDFDKEFLEQLEKNGFKGYVRHKEHINKIDIDSKLIVCSGLHSKIIIDYKGNYLFCDKIQRPGFMGLKDIYSQTLWQHWTSPEMNRLRYPAREYYKGTVCYGCNKFEKCKAKNSCYAKSYQQYHNFFEPEERVKHVCDKA